MMRMLSENDEDGLGECPLDGSKCFTAGTGVPYGRARAGVAKKVAQRERVDATCCKNTCERVSLIVKPERSSDTNDLFRNVQVAVDGCFRVGPTLGRDEDVLAHYRSTSAFVEDVAQLRCDREHYRCCQGRTDLQGDDTYNLAW